MKEWQKKQWFNKNWFDIKTNKKNINDNAFDKRMEYIRYSGNEEYMDTIWQKLPLFYRNALVRVYDEDERAKKYLQEFIAEHLQRHAS